ncbi:MAG: GNAT family N-acetyltransferase [Candidatus Woesearchaeota archaeon]
MIKIRQIKPTEWNDVRKTVMNIEHKTFEKALWYNEKDGDYDSFKLYGSINLIIYHDNNPAGYLMSSKLEDDKRCKKDPHYGKNDTIYADSMAILPAFQGRGLGKKLFKKFLTLAKKKYSRIILDATSENMVKLAEFFDFKKIKYYKKWEGNRPSWFMEKKY